MTECFIQIEDDDAPVRCDNCGWEGVASDLEMVNDIQERINAGCETPAGQCPEDDCGALAYLIKPPIWTMAGRLEIAKEQVKKLRQIVCLVVDPTITLPEGGTTKVDQAKLKEDAAALLATIED